MTTSTPCRWTGSAVDVISSSRSLTAPRYSLFLCLGDFVEHERRADGPGLCGRQQRRRRQNGAGENLNVIALDVDYVGFPTFGPGGELVFYAAEFGPDIRCARQPGTIYRVAPPTAAPETLASAEGLLPPQAWLDGTHVVVGYSGAAETWGTAIVGLDGTLQVLKTSPTPASSPSSRFPDLSIPGHSHILPEAACFREDFR
jgi:hypothetical protein